MPNARGLVFLFTIATALVGVRPSATIDVLTQHNDPARSGANLRETALSAETIASGRFGRLAVRPVDGNLYAQPLVIERARIAGRSSPTSVVLAATAHNSVYAFDADDEDQASTRALLWHTGPDTLGPSVPNEELGETIANGPHGCPDMAPEVGITGTPAVVLGSQEPREGTIFLVAKVRRGRGDFRYRLFALRLADGTPLAAGTAIEGDVPGNGHGATDSPSGRRVKFDPVIHLNRPALLVRDHVLYVAFGSHCDKRDYHGWLFAYDVSDPAAPRLIDVFCTTPNGRGRRAGDGAIWMSGQGPAMNEDGHIFFSTGDGGYDGKTEFGNSVLRVALEGGRFCVIDWYTPLHHRDLAAWDADLGSAGVTLVSDPGLLLTAGKEGRLYLIDAARMGRLARTPLQSLQVTNPPYPASRPSSFWNIHGAPVVWRGSGATFVYVWGEEDRLRRYRLQKTDGGPWQLEPAAVSAEFTPYPDAPAGRFQQERRRTNSVWMPGAVLSVSSDGTRAGTGLLWAAMGREGNANHRAVQGALRAYDASDVSRLLWDSTRETADDPGFFAKFTPPTIAGGRVFLATFQGSEPAALVVYGLRGHAR